MVQVLRRNHVLVSEAAEKEAAPEKEYWWQIAIGCGLMAIGGIIGKANYGVGSWQILVFMLIGGGIGWLIVEATDPERKRGES